MGGDQAPEGKWQQGCSTVSLAPVDRASRLWCRDVGATALTLRRWRRGFGAAVVTLVGRRQRLRRDGGAAAVTLASRRQLWFGQGAGGHWSAGVGSNCRTGRRRAGTGTGRLGLGAGWLDVAFLSPRRWCRSFGAAAVTLAGRRQLWLGVGRLGLGDGWLVGCMDGWLVG